MKHFTFFLLAAFLVACGKSDSSKSPELPQNQEENQPTVSIVLDGSNIQGTYIAKFGTLNPQVNGTIPGSATLKREEEKLFVYVRIFAGGPNVWHQQNMYVGNRCPIPSDDTNGDGFIDVLEGEAIWGKILIPFDADISSQSAGKNFYPVADGSGSYFYERMTRFSNVLKDLRKDSSSGDGSTVKLAPDEALEFEGKVVVVFGVSDSIVLPSSVQTLERRSPQKTLPIACGIISKASETIGVPDDGNIPGTIADVEENQDRPGEVNEERPENDENTNDTTTNETSSDETPTDDGNS